MLEKEVLQFLERLGLFEVVLPFLISFAVMWGVLDRTKVLGTEHGKPKAALNVVVALVIGMFSIVIIGQSPRFLALMQVGIYLTLSLFTLIFIAGLFFGTEWYEDKWLKVLGALIALVAVAYVFQLQQYLDSIGVIMLVIFGVGAFAWAAVHVFTPSKKPKKKKKTNGNGNGAKKKQDRKFVYPNIADGSLVEYSESEIPTLIKTGVLPAQAGRTVEEIESFVRRQQALQQQQIRQLQQRGRR